MFLPPPRPPPEPVSPGLELLFRPDEIIRDGRFADNAWLLELPRPFTRLSWDNAALIAPQTAARLGLETRDAVLIRTEHGEVTAPVFVLPGQADELRHAAARVRPASWRGRRPESGSTRSGCAAPPTRGRRRRRRSFGPDSSLRSPKAQGLDRIAGHEDLIREGTLTRYLEAPESFAKEDEKKSLYPQIRLSAERLGDGDRPQFLHRLPSLRHRLPGGKQHADGRQGTGAERTGSCTGCASTAITAGRRRSPRFASSRCRACIARRRRARSCARCTPPCTIIRRPQPDGLQPLRRHAVLLEQLPVQGAALQFLRTMPRTSSTATAKSWNPDVSVRGRGVMEKCTYCIQRIRDGVIDADRIRTGRSATAKSSPPASRPARRRRSSSAISTTPTARSSAARRGRSNYVLLEELNTWPRTSYLALRAQSQSWIGRRIEDA